MPVGRVRVLVVDDDDAVRALVASILIEEGHEVLAAPDGAEALRLLNTADRAGEQADPMDTAVQHGSSGSAWRPDLILLDMHMPRGDGLTFATAYRRLPPPHAPIVVFTAGSGGEASDAAREAGAAAVLAKPFDLEKLIALVSQAVPPQAAPPDSRSHSRTVPAA